MATRADETIIGKMGLFPQWKPAAGGFCTRGVIPEGFYGQKA